MKTWETICNIEKNDKLHIIFSRKMILRSSMMPLLCSLRSSFRGAGPRRYRPSSPASMVPRILSSLFLVLCPSASSCDIPPPSSCTLVLVFVFSRSKAQPHHPPVDGRSSTLAAESSLHTGALSTHQLSTTVSSASAHAPNRLTCLRLKRWHVLLSQGGCVPNEHRADPTPPPHHGQGRGGSKKESSSLRASPALHPPERPSPRRADIADHGLGRETRE